MMAFDAVPAEELKPGNVIRVRFVSGRTLAMVQDVRPGCWSELFNPDDRKAPRGPAIVVDVRLRDAVAPPAFPRGRTNFWTLHLAPDEVVERKPDEQ